MYKTREWEQGDGPVDQVPTVQVEKPGLGSLMPMSNKGMLIHIHKSWNLYF